VTDMTDLGSDGLTPKDHPAPRETGRPGSAAKGASAPPKPAQPHGRAARSLDDRVAILATALRRARIDNAERSDALSDLRGAEIARLEMLRDQLEPVLVQLPTDCDLFDVAVAPGERPRLFIDQLGFIEMARDRRTYRFLQDTRHGRLTLGESDKIDTMIESIASYMAHRLIEREKALSVDYASGGSAGDAARRAIARERAAAPEVSRSHDARLAMRIFLFFVEFLGSAAFFGMLGVLLFWLWRTFAPH
jgi:hypothetical protein